MEKEDKFKEFVKVRFFDDCYIDKQEEKEILDYGIKDLELTIDYMLQYLEQEKGYFLERYLEQKVEEVLDQKEDRKTINQQELDSLLDMLQQHTKGKVKKTILAKLVGRIVKDRELSIASDFFSKVKSFLPIKSIKTISEWIEDKID